MESIAVLIFSSLVDLGEAFNLVLRENSLMPFFQENTVWSALTLQTSQCPGNPTLPWQMACLINFEENQAPEHSCHAEIQLFSFFKVTRLFTACSHHNDFKPTSHFLKTSSHVVPVSTFRFFPGAKLNPLQCRLGPLTFIQH